MITVISIHTQRGYSRADHLIDDRPYQDFFGQTFASVHDIKKALNTKEITEQQDFHVRNLPLQVEIVLATGDRQWIEA